MISRFETLALSPGARNEHTDGQTDGESETNATTQPAKNKNRDIKRELSNHNKRKHASATQLKTMSSSDSYSLVKDDDTQEEVVTKAAAAVDAAACRAMELVRNFADQDPSDGQASNPWNNPTDIYHQLDLARDDVLQAWEELHLVQQQQQQQQQQRNISTVEEGATAERRSTDAEAVDNAAMNADEDDLRAQFMDMVTDAFADVLNQMKESEEEIDVEILVDCLQSGLDLMSVQDRELFFQDNSRTMNAMEEDEDGINSNTDKTADGPTLPTLTPHEKRRRELGFHVETIA
jgi:hypothetical protein